jgi:hypothetical protein
MKKEVTITLDEETLSGMVLDELQHNYLMLKQELDSRKRGESFAFFDADLSKDILIMTKHIEAFELILNYFGVSDPDYVI